jgi:monoamine oxidase
MAKYIRSLRSNAITFGARVTSIALKNNSGMEVVTNNTDRHQFSHVISTIPLSVLRTIDLSQADLSPMQSNALRALNYGPSVKIGLQFRTAWWTTGTDLDGKPLNIVGGQTYTDRPLRTVVYPSFGNVQAGATTTLIASYCWTEDASRLGALIDKGDVVLLELVLKELAVIHNVSVDFLRGQLIDCKGWSWSHDPYTMGKYV